jgi:hypothetical protein
LSTDAQRIVEHLPGQQADVVGEGRREQQRLALLRQHAVDVRQFFGEAQVEHTVGFIQHQGLQLIEFQRVLAEQVDQATRRGDQHINAAAQLHHLRIDADAAIHRISAQWQVFSVLAHRLMNLLRQLAGRHQNQCTRRIGGHFRSFHGQQLQQRQGETGGLAGAGLGRGHQVATGQNGRNGLRLDRRWSLVAELLEGAQQGFDQAKGGESHGSTVGKFSAIVRHECAMARSLP